ncbi:MAG: DNA methyltransferase [Solirubrobacterales bacterium]
MNLREIEESLAAIDDPEGSDLLYSLLRAYGLPKASISRLKNGTYDKADGPDEHLWKGKVYFRSTGGADDELYALIEAAREDEQVLREQPRFSIVSNGTKLLARDNSTASTLDIAVADLPSHAAFFLPWAGIEKTRLENLNVADVKAAEKMAKLYDEIIRHNSIETDEQRHELNVFFTRLLFCFFAEDTGVFAQASFTNSIGSLTDESGEDASQYFDGLFEFLDTEPAARRGAPAHLAGFGYVNGQLFRRRSPSPSFTARARSTVLECGTLDWSQINPDIFGSMMQAVVRPSQRGGLGMHYTSVENIMKVIRPLFLDELEEAFAGAGTVKKLERLLDRIAEIQIFDPACGSGNFLVISYKELRRLEHGILQRIADLEPRRAALFEYSRIDLESFYGIEIDDFAAEVATLSLWLAKHQMNREFADLFGVDIPLIPLVEAGHISCGNAARIDWGALVPEGPTFVLGNPPYQGGTLQSESQKQDLVLAFEDRSINKYLDYVSIWIFKAGQFVAGREGCEAGLVATNSITQGNQVGLLWPRVFELGVEISFAHSSFRWTNAARGNAGVSCVVIGLSRAGDRKAKDLVSGTSRIEARHINPYLVPDGGAEIVVQENTSIAGLPAMVFGSMPRDGGHLILDPAEADELVRLYPEAEQFIRRYGGARECISGAWRRCLWISDADAEAASLIPPIAERMKRVADFREASKAASTRAAAAHPYRFVQRAHRETPAILVPNVSSERRRYIPLGFVGRGTVISNLASAIYDAEPWLLGLLHSRMHVVWVEAIGGRLESRYRYSKNLVYNTFPAPLPVGRMKEELTQPALRILSAREHFPDATLAELYEPEAMPDILAEAHATLDNAVDRLFRPTPFDADADRLRVLFSMYEATLAEVA